MAFTVWKANDFEIVKGIFSLTEIDWKKIDIDE